MVTRDCIFCRIAREEPPGQIIYRDDRVFVIRDVQPQAPVHLLILPSITWLPWPMSGQARSR